MAVSENMLTFALAKLLITINPITMGDIQNVFHDGNDNNESLRSLMLVKHLFIVSVLNKSLLSLQRQGRSSLFTNKNLSVWNWKKD